MGTWTNNYVNGGGDPWYTGPDGQVAGMWGPGGEIIPVLIASTYANALINYPAATNVGRIIKMSNLNDALFMSNGSNYLPVGGSQVIAGDYGSLASPLATLTGVTSGLFAPPAGNIVLPIGLIIPGITILRPFAHFRRRGANGTGIVYIRIGTAGTTSDPSASGVSLSATNNLDLAAEPIVSFTSSTTYTTTNWAVSNQTATSAAVDRTGTLNTAAIQYMTFTLDAANALDSFDLVSYQLRIELVPG